MHLLHEKYLLKPKDKDTGAAPIVFLMLFLNSYVPIGIAFLIIILRVLTPLMHNVLKWPDSFKILQYLLQYFKSVSDHFGTLCMNWIIQI